MPEHFSNPARDLIHRILQPSVQSRLKIHEIRRHPWFKQHFPLYRIVRDSSAAAQFHNFKIDQQLFRRLISMDFNFGGKSREEIEQTIREGPEDLDYRIAYTLLEDDALRAISRERSELRFLGCLKV
jgi:hypothetical protein